MNDQPSPVPTVPRHIQDIRSRPSPVSCWAFSGLTCILPIIGPILALVFGIVALNKISKSGGTITGQGQAIAGLVLGGVGLVMIPIWRHMLLPALLRRGGKLAKPSASATSSRLGLASATYADQHDGKLPRNFDDLKDVMTNRPRFSPVLLPKDSIRLQLCVHGRDKCLEHEFEHCQSSARSKQTTVAACTLV